jgi:hypothetical protein
MAVKLSYPARWNNMNVKNIVISNFSALILGGKLWTDARHLVSTINGDTKLTGPQKRKAVFKDLQILAGDATALILNVAIELATLWVKGL